MRKYFLSLDHDGSGSIGAEELVDPLIALGLADSMAEVIKMVEAVDTDGSGEIEFSEFLELIKGGDDNTMAEFFKGIIAGSLIEGADILPFNLVVGFYRRERLIEGVLGADQKTREKGEQVLTNYSKYVQQKKAAEALKLGEWSTAAPAPRPKRNPVTRFTMRVPMNSPGK